MTDGPWAVAANGSPLKASWWTNGDDLTHFYSIDTDTFWHHCGGDLKASVMKNVAITDAGRNSIWRPLTKKSRVYAIWTMRDRSHEQGKDMTAEIREKLTRLCNMMENVRDRHRRIRDDLYKIEASLQSQNLSYVAHTSEPEGYIPRHTLVFACPKNEEEPMALYLRPINGSGSDAIRIEQMNAHQLNAALKLVPELLDKLIEYHSRLEAT